MNTVKHTINTYWFIAAPLAIILLIASSLGVGFIVQKSSVIAAFDALFYGLITSIPHTQFLDLLVWPFNNNFLSFGRPHPSFLVVLYGGFLMYLLLFKRRLLPWAIIGLILSTIIARYTLQLNNEYVFRERPFWFLPNSVDESVKLSLKSWTSYPSGHARDAAMYCTLIACIIPRLKPILFILAVFVGFTRLYLGVHYPTDVLAGLAIGFCTAVIAWFMITQFSALFQIFPIKAEAADKQ